jgi:hypothetical protein
MRFFWFIIAIGAGALVGVYFGWVRTPQSISNTSLSTLRSDYYADYVLMVAETYENNPDAALASYQLAYLGGDKPLYHVQKAIISAESLGYPLEDMETLAILASAFQTLNAPAPTP